MKRGTDQARAFANRLAHLGAANGRIKLTNAAITIVTSKGLSRCAPLNDAASRR